MEAVSRRKFVKCVLSTLAALPFASMFIPVAVAQEDDVLTVDEDGNAVLHGRKITVDKQNNATVK